MSDLQAQLQGVLDLETKATPVTAEIAAADSSDADAIKCKLAWNLLRPLIEVAMAVLSQHTLSSALCNCELCKALAALKEKMEEQQ